MTLVALGCLALGIIIGVIVSSLLSASPSRVRDLEKQLRELKENHRDYKESVSEHFSMTAELVQQMTQSYREVYQHLASGAQDLCSAEVANKLLPVDSDAVFDRTLPADDSEEIAPPRDYAAKQSPDQKGALAEDFGLEKARPSEPLTAVAEPEPPAAPTVSDDDRPVSAESPLQAEPEPEPVSEPMANTESEPQPEGVAQSDTETDAADGGASDAESKQEAQSLADDTDSQGGPEPEPEPEPGRSGSAG